MPRRCTVCDHEDVRAVNRQLVERVAYRRIASQYGLSEAAVRRHNKEHLPELLTKAYKAQEVAEAGSLLERVERLYKLTESIVAVTYRNQEWPTALAALRECRGHLELLGRISKELETAITINLVTSPEWEDLRTRLLLALEPHPEVRGRVLMAIEGGVSDSA